MKIQSFGAAKQKHFSFLKKILVLLSASVERSGVSLMQIRQKVTNNDNKKPRNY